MSIVETDSVTLAVERPSGLATRVVAAEITAGDGRTIDVRVVPYGERAKAADGLGGLPVGEMYEEEILPGCFDHQLKAANRVHVNYEHQKGILNVVGNGQELSSRSDGLYGSFRVLDTSAGDTALALVRAGGLGGVSFEARFRKSMRTASGVIQRVKADLVNIALCREPAYASAVVLGVREEPEIDDQFVIDEAFMPTDPNPELLARCRELGIRMPQRYQAHPDEDAGTPAATGTPADEGTRHDGDTPTEVEK